MSARVLFPTEAYELIGRIAEKLMTRSMRMGMAESCTGGLVSALCTELPGSSAWFTGGIIAYANTVKTALLGVKPDILHLHGAVSEPVVRAMAWGALAALGVDAAVSFSGVAGPDGGTPEKPVGTVWMAVSLRGKEEADTRAFVRHFSGTRTDIRLAACLAGLAALEQALDQLPA